MVSLMVILLLKLIFCKMEKEKKGGLHPLRGLYTSSPKLARTTYRPA